MALATVTNVAAELGRAVPADAPTLAQWNAWLARVEQMIRARIRDLDERIDDGTLTAALVSGIQAAAVARVVRNPEGLRQVTTSVDDGSVSKTRDVALSDGQLRITADEWALLLPPAPAGSIRPGFVPDCARGTWGLP